MGDKNKVLLEGTVCSEPRIQDFKSRKQSFRIATQRENMQYPDRNNVVAWAEVCTPLSEGDRVEVQGSMITRSYEKGGEKKWITECVASKITKLPNEDDDLPF